MDFNPAKLREFLTIMQENGVESGCLGSFQFQFRPDVAANQSSGTPLVPETPQDRYELLKQTMKDAEQEQLELEQWSAG